jgi:hypothetical protein
MQTYINGFNKKQMKPQNKNIKNLKFEISWRQQISLQKEPFPNQKSSDSLILWEQRTIANY